MLARTIFSLVVIVGRPNFKFNGKLDLSANTWRTHNGWLRRFLEITLVSHLEDIATIWQLLVSERFPIDSKQHVPNTHSVPLTEGNLGASLSVLNYIGANISKCERKCP